MKHLIKGMESAEHIALLLQLTRINSESVIDAVVDHLVRGVNEDSAAALNDVKRQKLDRAIDRLNEVAEIVYQINELRR